MSSVEVLLEANTKELDRKLAKLRDLLNAIAEDLTEYLGEDDEQGE